MLLLGQRPAGETAHLQRGKEEQVEARGGEAVSN